MNQPTSAAFRREEESRRMSQELTVQQRLRERDAEGDYVAAVVVEEVTFDDGVKTLLHFGNPYLERPTIVSLPSPLSKAEAEEIIKSIIPFPEACDVLSFIAENYSMRLPILIEGPTALGKTFLINKFVQLMYGKQAQPVDFYCQGQTDVSELMAKWVPRTESAEDEVRWELFAESEEGKASLEKIQGALVSLGSQDESARSVARALIDDSLRALTKASGISGRTEWQLQYGAVPKAMLGELSRQGAFRVKEPGGRGVPLHIQEVGLARPQVVASLLKLRGEMGQLASEIQLWEDGGRRIKAGPDFWVAMSTNPPEEYDAREPVDQALARGVVFKRLPELSDKAYEFMARRILGYKIGNIPPSRPLNSVLELHQHPEVCKEIADLVAHFHKQCVDAFRTGESSRQQRIPVTFDDMAATAAHALAQGVGAMLRQRLLAQARDTSLSWGARKYAVQALGRKTTAEEQTVLVTFLDSSDPTASLDAAAALAEAETCFVRPRLVKLIEAQLSSSNPLSAMSAVIALGRVRTVEERILMLKSLGHSFSVVRQGAAETLLRSGSDALDSSLYLSKVQEVVLAAVKEGISREVELAGALNSLFTEAGIA